LVMNHLGMVSIDLCLKLRLRFIGFVSLMVQMREFFSHPVHLHATHFRVLSRKGGRNRVMPWEMGLKDTILVHPSELVRVLVRFDAHPGLFLLHCHNLEHEDTGMMLNILVV